MVSERGGEMRTHGPTRTGRESGGFTAAVSAGFCLDNAASVLFKLTGLPEHDLLCLNNFECDRPTTERQIFQRSNPMLTSPGSVSTCNYGIVHFKEETLGGATERETNLQTSKPPPPKFHPSQVTSLVAALHESLHLAAEAVTPRRIAGKYTRNTPVCVRATLCYQRTYAADQRDGVK